MTTVTVFYMAVAYSVTAGLDARSTPSCRFTSERRGLSSHLALIRFVQHPLCLRFVSRLSSATDSDKLTGPLHRPVRTGVKGTRHFVEEAGSDQTLDL